MAPGRTPASLVDRWNQEIVKVLDDPAIREALTKRGLTPRATTGAELTDFMRKESEKWGTIVRQRRIVQQ